jgi:integrase
VVVSPLIAFAQSFSTLSMIASIWATSSDDKPSGSSPSYCRNQSNGPSGQPQRRSTSHFETGILHVRRAKAGTPATHPLTGRELRALRRLQRETGPSMHVFMSERKAPISVAGFQKMIERLSVRVKLGFQVHAHMLRHACGFKMANDGVDTRTIQAYLGHKDIRHTVRYTELSPVRFKGLWRD